MSYGSHNTTVPFNYKSNVGGKQRSKQAKPNRSARRVKWAYEIEEV